MKHNITAIIFAITLLTAGGVGATERQVALDTRGKLMVISAELAYDLRLFDDVPQFHDARLYVENDSLFTLEISAGPADSLSRERRPLTAAEVEKLRQDVSARLWSSAPELYYDQSGRTKLLTNSTVLGIFGYGPALPYALNVSDGASATGLYLISAGAFFFVPWLETERASVTRPAASLATYGLTRGALFSLQLAALVHQGDDGERELTAATMVGGIAAGFGGFALGSRKQMTEGRASLIGAGGDFGDAVGIALGALIDQEGTDDDRAKTALGCGLAGAAGGMLIENALALQYPYTNGDAYVIRGAGYLGIGVPLAIMGAADVSNDNTLLVGGIVGCATGIAVGHVIVQGQRYTTAAGQQAIVASLAGSMAGLGIGTIYRGNRNEDGGLYIGSMLGAVGGYGMSLYMHRRHMNIFGKRVSEAQVMPMLLPGSDGRMVMGAGVRVGIGK
jgi:hypothetical protein